MTAIRVVELSPVEAGHRDLLERLMQLYLHDFSEFAEIGSPHGELGEDARFPYPHLDDHWTDDGRTPLLTRADGHLAGFVLVNRWFASGIPADHALAEFFVIRKYRGAGVGTLAARAALARFPGTWELAVADYNRPALAFWRSALARIEGVRELTEQAGDGERWTGTIMRFTMARTPA